MKALADKIKAYMRNERQRIIKYGHDMENSLEMTRIVDPENDQRDYFRLSDACVDETLKVLSSILFEKEGRDSERERCLKVLNINKPNVDLDIVLETALQRAAEDIVRSKQEADMSDKLAITLETRLKVRECPFSFY